MERKSPQTYQRLLDADRASVLARSGHGNALAQIYNHLIMPLASSRDKTTQVVWGLKDFEKRFKRPAEGMWLSETAVNTETLEILADHGVKFTILSPHQARRVRPIKSTVTEKDWEDVTGARVDPSRPYRWVSPRGQEITLFFYDSPISHAVAFEGVLNNGETFASRLLSGFSSHRSDDQLVHIATDGESYGHHHRFGDMALAMALKRVRESGLATLTNYGEFLAKHPPVFEAEIIENSSWSCAHGVERWRSNCGCRLGNQSGWTQEWRGPLRDALNGLAVELDSLFVKEGSALMGDVWRARNDYIQVIMDRSEESLALFFKRHARQNPSDGEKVKILRLMEMQRQRLLMFTSCAWFFDEISGLESTTVLTSAARAIEIASDHADGVGLEKEFMVQLARAQSNIPEFVNGAVVYERFVKPVETRLERVAAHVALRSLWHGEEGKKTVYCFDTEFLERQTEKTPRASLSAGRIRVKSHITLETMETAYAVLHLGDHDFQCVLRRKPDQDLIQEGPTRLANSFLNGTLSDTMGLLSRYYDPKTYGLDDILLEERRGILNSVIGDVLKRFEETTRLFVDENKKFMAYLTQTAHPMPQAFRLALESVFGADMNLGLEQFRRDETDIGLLLHTRQEARRFHCDVNWSSVARAFQDKIEESVDSLAVHPTEQGVLRTLGFLDQAKKMDLDVSLWTAETTYFQVWQKIRRLKTEKNSPFLLLAERFRMVL